MKRVTICIVMAVVLISLKNLNAQQQKPANGFVIGHLDSIRSDILGEMRKFWVYLPKGNTPVTSQQKYPAVYLLDGAAFFHPVTGMVHHLGLSKAIPEMAVIAIQNTNRGRDQTPTHMDVSFWTGDSIPNSGGGDTFMKFIEQELITYVENKYNLSDYRTFIGHSLGGLMVINTLVTNPDLFDNYCAIDPSLWWDNQFLLDIANTCLNNSIYERKSLYVGIANTIPDDLDIHTLETDTTKKTIHLRSLFKFVKSTERKNENGLHFSWKFYENDDHQSSVLIAAYDALRFFTPWYRLKLSDKYYSQPYSKKYEDELIRHITRHYDTISYYFGYTVIPPEITINHLGSSLLYFWQKPQYALALFLLNVNNYHESVSAYETMGEYYLSQSDTTNAIEWYSKAIEIGDDETYAKLVEKLNKLKLKIK